NPFYVKSHHLRLAGVGTVTRYVRHVVTVLGPAVIAAAVVLGSRLRRGGHRFGDVRSSDVWLLLVPPALALLYAATITHEVGGDYRFSYPTYMYLVTLTAAAVALAYTDAPD